MHRHPSVDDTQNGSYPSTPRLAVRFKWNQYRHFKLHGLPIAICGDSASMRASGRCKASCSAQVKQSPAIPLAGIVVTTSPRDMWMWGPRQVQHCHCDDSDRLCNLTPSISRRGSCHRLLRSTILHMRPLRDNCPRSAVASRAPGFCSKPLRSSVPVWESSGQSLTSVNFILTT